MSMLTYLYSQRNHLEDGVGLLWQQQLINEEHKQSSQLRELSETTWTARVSVQRRMRRKHRSVSNVCRGDQAFYNGSVWRYRKFWIFSDIGTLWPGFDLCYKHRNVRFSASKTPSSVYAYGLRSETVGSAMFAAAGDYISLSGILSVKMQFHDAHDPYQQS